MASMTATEDRRCSHAPINRASPGGLAAHAALDLGALPTAPGCGRAWTRQILWEWSLARCKVHRAPGVELVTNAVQISRAAMQGAPPPIRLWLVSDKAQVVILVWDASPITPVAVHASEDAETGRGLLLVGRRQRALGPLHLRRRGQGRVGRHVRNRRFRDRPKPQPPRSQPCPGVAARASSRGAAPATEIPDPSRTSAGPP